MTLWILVFGQIVLSLIILYDFLWVWQDPALHPGEWAHVSQFPKWSAPSIVDLFLGVLIMPICGCAMIQRWAWAPIAYCAWLIPSIAFNALKPHYYIDLFWFPRAAPLIFIGFFYIGYDRWARTQEVAGAAARKSSREHDPGSMLTRHRILGVIVVLFLTLGSTILYALLLALLSLVLPKALVTFGYGAGVLSIYLFAGFIVRCFAASLLYDRADRAELQIFGGMPRRGLFGGGPSWPFAKLSASREAIRLQTPFGIRVWQKVDPRWVVRKAGLGRWSLGAEDADLTECTIFATWPWSGKRVDRKLKELGYTVRPRTWSTNLRQRRDGLCRVASSLMDSHVELARDHLRLHRPRVRGVSEARPRHPR